MMEGALSHWVLYKQNYCAARQNPRAGAHRLSCPLSVQGVSQALSARWGYQNLTWLPCSYHWTAMLPTKL